jgi:uncharacterized membrane protein
MKARGRGTLQAGGKPILAGCRHLCGDDFMDFPFAIAMVSRWLHILAAITAVGGTIFIRYALLPTLATLPDDERRSLHEQLRARWSKVVMASIFFLLASGIYNFIVINRTLSLTPELKEMKTIYHALFGVKFLIGLSIFFIASALVGRSSAFEKLRANAKLWATVNVTLAVVLVCVSGYMRLSRDAAALAPHAAAQQTAK